MAFILILGIGFLALTAWGIRGLIRAYRKEDRLTRGITVPGEVIDTITEVKIIQDSDSNRRRITITYPVFRFQTTDGRTLTQRSPYADDSVVAGTRVNVTYAADDPTQVRVAGNPSGTLAILAGAVALTILGLFGLILTIVGALGLS